MDRPATTTSSNSFMDALLNWTGNCCVGGGPIVDHAIASSDADRQHEELGVRRCPYAVKEPRTPADDAE